MKSAFILALVSLSLAACQSSGFPTQTANTVHKVGGDQRIEISLAPGSFAITEVEFHVDASKLPDHIIAAAKKHIPGGVIGDCEIEYHGNKTFYEVSALRNGLEEEVMFTDKGEPHSWELEVALSDLPEAVRETATSTIAGAKLDKAEKIMDGSKTLLEYHFKLSKDGKKFKVVITTEGKLVRIYRETIGEIEVPIR